MSKLPELENEDIIYLKKLVTITPNYPKKKIDFIDVTTILSDHVGRFIIKKHSEKLFYGIFGKDFTEFDGVVGLESRGYLIGMLLAEKFKIKFIRMGKKDAKIPGDCEYSEVYGTEYSNDQFKIKKSDITPGKRYLVVDDITATGGSGVAACNLVEKLGGKADFWTLGQVPELKEIAQEKLKKWNCTTILDFSFN